jgi:peptidoglycan hydrolase-like protein with peptidoglycan-binding domain
MKIIDTNLQFRGLSYGNNPQKIIVHHAEASHCTVYDVHQWHLENGWTGIGYHFFVDKQGNVYKGRPVEAIGSHCLHQNAVSIGICAEGDYMTEVMPDAQKKAIIELIQYLRSQYGEVPVLGHAEAMNYETSCPGINYPLEDIKNLKDVAYSDDFIKSVQHDLQRVSCLERGEVNADGEIGPKTKAAINQFRYIVDLPSNSNIDDALISALNVVTKKPTIGSGWNSNLVATKFLKWYIGITPKNELWDANTIEKVKAWQIKVGIWSASGADGVVREKDWNKILK